MQQMAIVHRAQHKTTSPAGLLQCKTKLLADTAVLDAFLSKQDGVVVFQCVAEAFRQGINPYQLPAVCGNSFLKQQIARGKNFFRFSTIADKSDFRSVPLLDFIKGMAGAAQSSQRRFFFPSGIPDGPGAFPSRTRYSSQ